MWTMEIIRTPVGAFLLAGLVGLFVSSGLFLLRRRAWDLVRILGLSILSALALGAVSIVFTAFKSSGLGGDAGMNATVFLIFGIMATGMGLMFAFLIGANQARALGIPVLSGLYIGVPDAAALALCMFGGMSFINKYVEEPATEKWWKQELDRRQRRERQKQEIPMPYREMGYDFLQSLDEHRRQNRQMGLPEPNMIPRDAENKLRNYWNEAANPPEAPFTDRSKYETAAKMKKFGMPGLVIGWIGGAFVLPWVLRRRTFKTNEPNPKTEPGS